VNKNPVAEGHSFCSKYAASFQMSLEQLQAVAYATDDSSRDF